MQSTNEQQIEKVNYLAAGLIAAAGIHSLLCLLTLPSLSAVAAAGATEIAIKVLKILWTIAGVAGGVVVAFYSSFMINGRSYRKARIAAVGALLLPLLGTIGIVTAFPLLPVAIMSITMLFNTKWKAAFSDGWTDGAMPESA